MTEAAPDPAPLEMVGLELPLDFSRTPAGGTLLESHEFDLVVPTPDAMPGAAPGSSLTSEALVAAAFGIQLFRYNGQASIPLWASRLATSGRLSWTSLLNLRTDSEITTGELLDQTSELLTSKPLPPPTGPQTGNMAAITWLEPGPRNADLDLSAVLRGWAVLSRDADLHLVISPVGGGHRAAFVYNASLFKRNTIERFAGHLVVLLGHLAGQRDLPISALSLLTEPERRWLDEMSRGQTPSLSPHHAHELFEQQAAAQPEAVAVRYRGQQLTYAQLNRRANQLAGYLSAQRIGAESRVVVCVEPGFDIAVALLGILKAGAVYVPLDPAYPPARIRTILDDTRPALLISRSSMGAWLALDDVRVLPLDDSDAMLGEYPVDNPCTAIDRNQTAFVYYTSGTTGRPKGVMASQANLTAYLQLARDRYQVTSREVMPAIARFSFSISMFELMTPLTAGGTLLILDREHVLDVPRMAETLKDVTFFHAGPSLLRNLLAHIKRHYPDFSVFAGVRHASSGGDMIAPELLQSLLQIFGNAEVFVIYGCSEISCMGCTYPVPRDAPVARTYVGKPFENMVVKVLDRTLRPVPIGVAGEVHFAGAGVVKGYLDRDELTAEKFVSIDGERFYRTGDIGRVSEDGWVEVLGRNDFQIKVRGMRIELGEVEHVLRSAPGVREGVVVARATLEGEKALVAYVVVDGSGGAPEEDNRSAALAAIRWHMTEKLPDYMVPATYVALARMPLNHNMKLDRNALPEPERPDQRTATDPGRRRPETPTEQSLAVLWADLLKLEHIGLDDNFFELGGDSLLAIQLIMGIERDLGIVVDGMDVLREPLEILAAICDQGLGRPATKPRPTGPRMAAGDTLTTLHFGPGDSLYGVLHLPTSTRATTAALICAPLGQESVRTHFVLNRLARQLATHGVPVLRFDYYGFGESLGESTEGTCRRWEQDIADAHAELRRRTGATRVVCIGVRLGATLLVNAWQRLGIDASRLVLWDPVCDGAAFYAELTKMHREFLRAMQNLRLGRPVRRRAGVEELMGSTYSDQALQEMKALMIAVASRDPSAPAGKSHFLESLVTFRSPRQHTQPSDVSNATGGGRIEELNVDCGWYENGRFEEILPDVGIGRALAAMVTEPA